MMTTAPYCPGCGHPTRGHLANTGCIAGWNATTIHGCGCTLYPGAPVTNSDIATYVRHIVVSELLGLAESWKHGPDGDDSLSDGWTSHYVEQLTNRARQIACDHQRLFVQHIGTDTWTICPDCDTKIHGDLSLLTDPSRTT